MEPGPSPSPSTTPAQDEEHLRMLHIFFWIYAGLQALVMCCTGGYFMFFGALFATAATSQVGQNGPPAALGGLFGGMGLLIALFLGGFAFLHYSAGRALKERRNSTLIYVAAGLACLSFPIGTALGVFTFVVMSRPSVKALFSS